MRSGTVLTVLALVLVACQTAATDGDTTAAASPSPAPTPTPSAPTMSNNDVQLTLDRTTYASGADVRMTIANRSPLDLGYNPCTRLVERESGSAWTPVPEPDRVCTMELRLLARAETVTETTDLPALQPGRYRIALNMSDESGSRNGPRRAVSAPFQVR